MMSVAVMGPTTWTRGLLAFNFMPTGKQITYSRFGLNLKCHVERDQCSTGPNRKRFLPFLSITVLLLLVNASPRSRFSAEKE
ncbi:hypothetical protein ACSQ67_006460 [Phaseolus vulgaris]